MRIDATIEDQEVQNLLKQVAQRVGNMEPALRTIGETMVSSIRRNFSAGGRPVKWPESMRVKIHGGQTLRDTNVLMNSINVGQVGADFVDVGTSDQRANVHHHGAKKGSFGTFAVKVEGHERKISQAFGRQLKGTIAVKVKTHTRNTKLPWGDIPARPFMMIQDEDWTEIKASLVEFLEG